MTSYPDEDAISSKVHRSEAHGVRATAFICQFNPDHSHLLDCSLKDKKNSKKARDKPFKVNYT